ncbi:MAG: methylenetetrahydrofolate reductase [NAD(P)H] [Gammaproteobacteria bacterium]|nr:methylenetetrahydrofolate reductase [NAD(P)H] [Gammaproteobacteria bacterium]NIR60557.1 methylenetetrahydrofolate reductase [NAD(P)H] [Gammaproteobacteria bacterium]
MESQRKHERIYSFEFFPPKTPEGQEKLRATYKRLEELNPRFFSVTFGAGGSTRDRTFETVTEIQAASQIEAAPHLSCIGSSREQVRELIEKYRQHDIKHIVTLRGDRPSGTAGPSELRYANELVEFIRAHWGDELSLEVGCYPEMHPEAKDPEADLQHFVRKVRAGANSAITQYFFNADAYFDFVDRCESKGVDLPIVPGVMPITNYRQLARFSDGCGAEIPRWIRKRLEMYDDREDMASLAAFGVDVVTKLCDRLLEAGAPGLHFYTLNKADPTIKLWRNLGLPR